MQSIHSIHSIDSIPVHSRFLLCFPLLFFTYHPFPFPPFFFAPLFSFRPFLPTSFHVLFSLNTPPLNIYPNAPQSFFYLLQQTLEESGGFLRQVLYCAVMCCTVLYCSVLHCAALCTHHPYPLPSLTPRPLSHSFTHMHTPPTPPPNPFSHALLPSSFTSPRLLSIPTPPHPPHPQFLVDDKGCVAIAMWGVPCFTYPNDCSRGLYCAVSMSQKVDAIGHHCSIGVTTGNVYCGNVGR